MDHDNRRSKIVKSLTIIYIKYSNRIDILFEQ